MSEKTVVEKPLTSDKKLRIHTILGTKGGVGKSTIASHLADWFATRGLKGVFFDLDDETHTFTRYVKGVKQLNTRDVEQTDELVFDAENLVGQADGMVLDLRAGAGNEMLAWFKEVPFEDLKKANIEFVGWGCVTTDQDSLSTVEAWIKELAEQKALADVIIVRNHKDGVVSKVPVVDNINCHFIDVEEIPTKLMSKLNDRNLTLTGALEQPKGERGLTDTMMRSRILRFRDGIFQQFDKLKTVILGS